MRFATMTRTAALAALTAATLGLSACATVGQTGGGDAVSLKAQQKGKEDNK